MSQELEQLVVQHDQDLRCALQVIDRNAQGVCFAIKDGRVVGVLTDGDIRRALINGAGLECFVSEVMRKDFKWLPCDATTNEIQNTLSNKIRHIPLLGKDSQLVDFACAYHFHNIPVAQPELHGNELAYVTDCIQSGWVSSQGKYVNKFEYEFSEYINATYTIAVSNGTVALHLALLALGVGPGDEVLVPDLTFAASVNAVIYVGAIPVLVDVDPDTLCIDPLAAAELVTSKTRAIIPVHLYGHPADMDAIIVLASKHNLLVIEDCAEAVGSRINNNHVGTFSDAAIFSFYGNKTITTGEGGMLVFKDAGIHKRAKMLRDHGMDPERRYWHVEVGYNYRLTNVQAAIGVAQLERANDFVEKKRWIAKQYTERLDGILNLKLPGEYGNVVNSYWLFTIELINSLAGDRDELLRRLTLNGIEARQVFIPMHDMPPYKQYSRNAAGYPVSSRVSRSSISLPSSVALSEFEIESVCHVIEEIDQRITLD